LTDQKLSCYDGKLSEKYVVTRIIRNQKSIFQPLRRSILGYGRVLVLVFTASFAGIGIGAGSIGYGKTRSFTFVMRAGRFLRKLPRFYGCVFINNKNGALPKA
jgi:hypothetical protein|tara:strand:- start:3295 stop:3603 length:309 start_codon:yes stop_codon:yes gene_type:complete